MESLENVGFSKTKNPVPVAPNVVTRFSTPVPACTLAATGNGSPYDVHDGKGQVVQNKNIYFRSLLRSVHEEYKATRKRDEKRTIARQVYADVTRQGGKFLDSNGRPKTEVEAMKRIMKSLKDMPSRPTLHPHSNVIQSLPPNLESIPSSQQLGCHILSAADVASASRDVSAMPMNSNFTHSPTVFYVQRDQHASFESSVTVATFSVEPDQPSSTSPFPSPSMMLLHPTARSNYSQLMQQTGWSSLSSSQAYAGITGPPMARPSATLPETDPFLAQTRPGHGAFSTKSDLTYEAIGASDLQLLLESGGKTESAPSDAPPIVYEKQSPPTDNR
jgi:hypothetical protein